MRTVGALFALLLSTTLLVGRADAAPAVEPDAVGDDASVDAVPAVAEGDDAPATDDEAAVDREDADVAARAAAPGSADSDDSDDDASAVEPIEPASARHKRHDAATVPARADAKPRIAAAIPPRRHHASAAAQTWHVVASGQTLTAIARQYGCTVAELQAANHLESALIRPEQRLLVPAAGAAVMTAAARLPAIAVVAGQSVGQPWHGRLRDPMRFPDGVGYLVRRPLRAFGASHVVTQLERAITAVRTRFPSLHTLAIGDSSARRGGALTEHRSHQSGRDVDVGLYYTAVPRGYPQSFIAATDDNLDCAATWALLFAFARTAEQPTGVSAIFLDFQVQGLLYEWALDHGVPQGYLDRLFQYPHGEGAAVGLIRHAPNHNDHMHVRFKCPPGDAGCR